jgi:hypothetical protein
MVGNGVDVEEHGAGDVRLGVILGGGRRDPRQLERRIRHGDAFIAQMRREPFGRDQDLGMDIA